MRTHVSIKDVAVTVNNRPEARILQVEVAGEPWLTLEGKQIGRFLEALRVALDLSARKFT